MVRLRHLGLCGCVQEAENMEAAGIDYRVQVDLADVFQSAHEEGVCQQLLALATYFHVSVPDILVQLL